MEKHIHHKFHSVAEAVMTESNEQEKPKIVVDEDWKSKVQREKEEASQAAQQKQQAEPGEDDNGPPPGPLPPADFPSLISILTTQAAAALGEAQNPDAKHVDSLLDQARFVIDLLDVLQQKTKGNLTPEEDQSLEKILHDLRMAFVEAKKTVKR